jgi:hypothetical protein
MKINSPGREAQGEGRQRRCGEQKRRRRKKDGSYQAVCSLKLKPECGYNHNKHTQHVNWYLQL